VTQPKLLVLDEPTEGIQPNVITQIGEIIRSLVEEKGMTILLVEQYVDFVRKFAHSFPGDESRSFRCQREYFRTR